MTNLPARLPDNLPALADDAIRAIKAARSLGEVRNHRDVFRAYQHVAKCLGAAREAKNACAKVVVIAMQAEGNALAGMEKAKGSPGPGRGKKPPDTLLGGFNDAPTLKELGVSYAEASRAQRIASIPEETLQAHFAAVEMDDGEITTAGVLRLVAKDKPAKEKPKPKPKDDAFSPAELCILDLRDVVAATINEMLEEDADAAAVRELIAELHRELDHIAHKIERKLADVHHPARQSPEVAAR